MRQNVAILDIRDTDDATAKLQALYPDEQSVVFIKTDVVKRENVWQSFAEARELFGSIDVVIGNAGILNENQPELVVQINLVSFYFFILNIFGISFEAAAQAAVEFMGKTNGGNGGIVLNMSSVCGLDIVGGVPSYTASKFGIVGLTRTYAVSELSNLSSNTNLKNTCSIMQFSHVERYLRRSWYEIYRRLPKSHTNSTSG